MTTPGDPVDASATTDPAEVRRDAEMTRAELAKTINALAAKADVKGRAQHKAAQTRAQAQERVRELTGQAEDKARGFTGRVQQAARDQPLVLVAAAGIVLVVVLAVVRRGDS